MATLNPATASISSMASSSSSRERNAAGGGGGGACHSPRDASPDVSTSSQQPCVVVFGAINMDVKATTETAWPTYGDATARGTSSMLPGGKAANEAVALSRLGINTALVGRVGKDRNGEYLKELLSNDEGIDVSNVQENGATGTAIQIVTSSDNKKFTVSCSEANANVDITDVGRAIRAISERRASGRRVVCLIQYELDGRPQQHLLQQIQKMVQADDKSAVSTSSATSRRPSPWEAARQVPADVRTISVAFKPSPLLGGDAADGARRLLDESGVVGILFVNESEGPLLLKGHGAKGDWDYERSPKLCTLGQAERCAALLLERHTHLRSQIVTIESGHKAVERSGGWLGVRGGASPEHLSFVLPRAQKRADTVVDVIGAADAFIGGFIGAQLHGKRTAESLLWGEAAAARSTQASGGIAGLPTREEMESFLAGSAQQGAPAAAAGAAARGYDATGCVVDGGDPGAAAVLASMRVVAAEDLDEPNWLHMAVLRGDLRVAWRRLPPSTSAAAAAAAAAVAWRLRGGDVAAAAAPRRARSGRQRRRAGSTRCNSCSRASTPSASRQSSALTRSGCSARIGRTRCACASRPGRASGSSS